MKAEYTKKVTMVKGESEIVAHLSRGEFKKYLGDKEIVVDGEFGRCGGRCFNDWHGDYPSMKVAFTAYVGEKVLEGYQVKAIEVKV